MTQSYYRGADCVILVYDASTEASFTPIPKWHEEVKRYAKKANVALILCGNKSDLTKTVDPEKAKVIVIKICVIEIFYRKYGNHCLILEDFSRLRHWMALMLWKRLRLGFGNCKNINRIKKFQNIALFRH
jgi:GTPase SAR1 family protein